MKNKLLIVRISYWVGAIMDALTIIPMLSPKIGGLMFGISNFNPGKDYRYAMGLAASLMLGWTFLLLWADQKPIERKGVLLLTIFPVLVGLFLSGIYAVHSSMILVDKMVPLWVIQIVIIFLFSYSYKQAKSLE